MPISYIVICVLSGSKYSSVFSLMALLGEKKLLNKNCVFWIFQQLSSETLLILGRNGRHMIKNVYWSSLKVPVIVVSFQWNSKSLDTFSKNIRIHKFMNIRPVGVELFHAEGRTDRHDKAHSRFSQFRYAPKMDLFYRSRVTIWRGTYSLCSVRTATVIVSKRAPNTSNSKQTRYPKCCVLFGLLHGQG